MQYINTWFQVYNLRVLGLASMLLFAVQAQGKLSESDILPDLSTFGLSGDLPDMDGKVILLDFWASWCAPCKASFPAMDDIYNEYKDQGFVILAVSIDDKAANYEKFAAKSKVSFPLMLDVEKKLVKTAKIDAMPTSFLIDKKGVIRSVHNGYNGKKTIETYRKEIQALLAE